MDVVPKVPVLAYNGAVQIRLALDGRKLTDYGIGTYLYHLIRGLAESPEVKLTILGRPEHEERVAALAGKAHFIPVTARGYTFREHLLLPKVLWREKIDLVHIPHYVVPIFMPRPMVVTVHDVIQIFYPPRERSHLALFYVRAMMRSALRRARAVIVVSRTTRRDLVQLFGIARSRLSVVANGVDPDLAERPDAEVIDDVKARYHLKSPLVLVVGNDKPHKNLDLMLRAFHLACRRHGLPGQLVFVGGEGVADRFAGRAQRLGLEDRVRFLGRVPSADLLTLYHVAAVQLHVALYEGFGLPVLEAMRAGLPVITSNLGAMAEIGEGAARLVNPLDVDEVAAALEQVLVDDPMRRRMIDAGRKRADSLTWEKTVEGTMAVYRKALKEA